MDVEDPFNKEPRRHPALKVESDAAVRCTFYTHLGTSGLWVYNACLHLVQGATTHPTNWDSERMCLTCLIAPCKNESFAYLLCFFPAVIRSFF